MARIRWYFPENIDEAAALSLKKGVILHAGGTGIIRRGTANIRGLVDLRKLGLNYFREDGGFIEIGAMQSFSDTAENVRKIDPSSILSRALLNIVPPLRNRITIGGSIALFPMWSDLMGPLMALDADVVLAGKTSGNFKISDYAANRELKEGTVIKAVRFKNERRDGFYCRAARTMFDYSAFNITVLLRRGNDGKISDARAFVVGSREKYNRLTGLEDGLKGRALNEMDMSAIANGVDMDFSAKKLGSAEYLKQLARVEIERGLNGIFKR